MKCYNCDKNALYDVGEDGKQIPLCLDCYIKLKNIQLQQLEASRREINYLTDEMEFVGGIPGVLPKYPELPPKYIIRSEGVTLNNINVNNSKIGVLNTGNIESVDSTVTVLKGSGNNQLASTITELTEAVIKSDKISNKQKNQIIELLSTLASEAVVPKEDRKTTVINAIFTKLSGILSGISTLDRVWNKTKSIFEQIF